MVLVLGFIGLTARLLDSAPLPSQQASSPSVVYDRYGTELAYLLPLDGSTELGQAPASLTSLEAMAPAFVAAASEVTQPQNQKVSAPEVLSRLWSSLSVAESDQTATLAELYAQMTSGQSPSYSPSLTDRLTQTLLINRIERDSLPPQLLELYLNVAPFGRTANGIDEASQAWFGVSSSDLQVGQAAFLAAWVAAPEVMPAGVQMPLDFAGPTASSAEQTARATEARNAVLFLMFQAAVITADELEAERAVPLTELVLPFQEPNQIHLLEAATSPDASLAELMAAVRSELVERYGERTVNRGGLHIVTTIDLPYQRAAIKSVNGAATSRSGSAFETLTTPEPPLASRADNDPTASPSEENSPTAASEPPGANSDESGEGGEAGSLASARDTSATLTTQTPTLTTQTPTLTTQTPTLTTTNQTNTQLIVLDDTGGVRAAVGDVFKQSHLAGNLLTPLSDWAEVTTPLSSTVANAASAHSVIAHAGQLRQPYLVAYVGVALPPELVAGELAGINPTAAEAIADQAAARAEARAQAYGSSGPPLERPELRYTQVAATASVQQLAAELMAPFTQATATLSYEVANLPITARLVAVPLTTANSEADTPTDPASEPAETDRPANTNPTNTDPTSTEPPLVAHWLIGWSDQVLVALHSSGATNPAVTFADLMQALHFWPLP